MAKYKVKLVPSEAVIEFLEGDEEKAGQVRVTFKGNEAEIELKDKEAVRRLFHNHGFWDGGRFYAAAAILSITPAVEDVELESLE